MGPEPQFGFGVLAVDRQEFVTLLRRQGEHLGNSSSVVVDPVVSSP